MKRTGGCSEGVNACVCAASAIRLALLFIIYRERQSRLPLQRSSALQHARGAAQRGCCGAPVSGRGNRD
ncbi:hypothetical protein Y032_0031g2416 [Ancylostoma ceylanicum]|uniref:Uncharacterized protein n=1 Tax=Ancylostoma ceylanicum TaxID=53326 RepID=A0A016US75_9BILA|nr:hypothetical protein Y032_0031g2416 [Ancylostoma ceylanicum]